MTSSGFLRATRHVLGILLILAIAGGVIGYTWYASARTTAAWREDVLRRANAQAAGLAASYAEQMSRQVLAFDQTLDGMVKAWEADPRQFNLEPARAQATSLNGISRDMFLTDENGIIRQASVPEFLGQSAAELDTFRDAAEHSNDKTGLYLGETAVNPIMRQWHLDMARTLHHPDGSFAGLIDADYRVSAITDMFDASSPPEDAYAAVVGLTDGKLRAVYGQARATQGASVADTPMFGAVDATESGAWVGPSAGDAVVRIHAFRRLPGRDLAVVAGVSQEVVLRPVAIWALQTRLFASAVTGLTLIVCILLIGTMRGARRRAAKAREDHAYLAAANALAEVSRAQSEATARRLQATFAAVTEGIAIFDAHLNLVEWNGLFPERAGVNASFIRTGMPMEDVLRTQAEAGAFGANVNVDAEVERRTALLRAGNFGASLTFQSEGRAIDLRCRPLAEGGFVALYADVTDTRRARQAARDARDALAEERSARVRFLDGVSHELRERAAYLLRAVGRLQSLTLPRAASEAVALVHRAAVPVADLAADSAEIPAMEADRVVPQPALIALAPLLRAAIDTMQATAQDRGLTVYLVVEESAPAELIADPDRIRQIVRLLMSEAMRFATPETMWLLADGGEPRDRETVALRLTVRGFGPHIPDAPRAVMFRPFTEVTAPTPDQPRSGTGLEGAIVRHLATLMGGAVRCEAWSTNAGRTGNDFILLLPPSLLPGRLGRAPGQTPAEGRVLPRTRVLLAGARTGLRMAAVTMLRRDGHMVDTVVTGTEAMQALQAAPYDILFLDTLLEDRTLEAAVEAIREMTGPPRTMPIIALAPAHDESEERSWRVAGVDGILVDPPSLADLVGAIGQYVWLSRSSGPGLGGMAGLADDTEEGIPILSAERIAELRANIQAAELMEMVEECIADLHHRLPALTRALSGGSTGAIMAQAHAMLGVAAGYGMNVLAARLRAITIAARDRRLDTIDGAAGVVEADLTRAAVALRRVMRQPLAAQ